jgi:hypothetical protein
MLTTEYIARLSGLSEAEITEGLRLEAERQSIDDALIAATHADEMDAPSDWDAGTITFDPYV